MPPPTHNLRPDVPVLAPDNPMWNVVGIDCCFLQGDGTKQEAVGKDKIYMAYSRTICLAPSQFRFCDGTSGDDPHVVKTESLCDIQVVVTSTAEEPRGLILHSFRGISRPS